MCSMLAFDNSFPFCEDDHFLFTIESDLLLYTVHMSMTLCVDDDDDGVYDFRTGGTREFQWSLESKKIIHTGQ
jgi:hypothetical protein